MCHSSRQDAVLMLKPGKPISALHWNYARLKKVTDTQ